VGNTSLRCTVPAGATTCRITGLPARTSYTFSVVAVGGTGHSAAVTGSAVMATRTTRTATYFGAGSASLTRAMKARLSAFTASLPRGATVVTVDVVGYVQASRNRANDRSLSLARARAVAAYLGQHGVHVRISVHGKGILGRTPWSRATVSLTYAAQRPAPLPI
jgi:outer membrane protein OmpA-like peptidoglycan-associated protein